MEEFKHSEKSIQDELTAYYRQGATYIVPNVFLFGNRWESDLFVLRKSGYGMEIEVKISKFDFLKDFKKVDKHMILEKGLVDPRSSTHVYDKITKSWIETKHEPVEVGFRPNQFYYAVPFGLISVDEVPAYAGLITIGDGVYSRGVYIQKKAPFLHKTKLDYDTHLCNKFYFYWRNEQIKSEELKRRVEYLNNKLI